MSVGAKPSSDKPLLLQSSDVELTCAIYHALKLRSGSFSGRTGGVLGQLQYAVAVASHNGDRTLSLCYSHDAAVLSWGDLRTPL